MCSINRFLALVLPCLLWIVTFFCNADASLIKPLHPTAQLPFQLSPQDSRNVKGGSWSSRVRNGIIQRLWRIPPNDALGKTSSKKSPASRPPPTLLAQYGGDLVLRFEIKSIQEAEALADAVNVLFLDVWEFTTEWADIRLSKDVVSMRLSKARS